MNDRIRKHLKAYAMIAPAMILFATFMVIPAFLALIIGFKKINLTEGILGSPWIGWANFEMLFTNPFVANRITTAFANTLLFTICFVPVNLFLSIVLASMIHSLSDRFQSFYRAAFYLPTVTSAIVFGMIWKWLYDYNYGLLNFVLAKIGIGPISWTGDPDWAIWSIIIASIGMGPGGNILIYLAALGSVPNDTMESARVEGANGMQAWWHVVLPHLKPVTLYLLVLNTIGSFQVFDLVFILTSGGPAGSSTVIVYEIYDLAFGKGNYGAAGALSLILLVIVATLAFLQFYFLGGSPDESGRRTVFTKLGETVGDGISRLLGTLGDAGAKVTGLVRRAFSIMKPRPSKRRMVSPSGEVAFNPSRRWLNDLPMHLLLFPLAALFLFPMIWMFLSALTPSPYLQSNPPQVSLENMTLSNYHRLMQITVPQLFVQTEDLLWPLKPDMSLWDQVVVLFTSGGIPRWFWNSAYLSLLITVVQVLLSCLTGYVFARLAFPGRGLIFTLLIGSILLPGQALVIPLFIVISSGIRNVFHLDLLNTHWALILPAVCSPVGIFLMRQFIMGIPRDLDEAARIDGCGELSVWWRIILPLCKPILGAWGILTFTTIWRAFFWPFVVLGSDELYTLEVGLQTLQQQQGQDFGLVMAGASMSAIPMIIIFFIFQKQIVRGLTFGAVKG